MTPRTAAKSRRWSAHLSALVAVCALGGCFNPLITSNHLVEKIRMPAAGNTPKTDLIALEVSVLEIPLTDRDGLAAVWSAADEQIVPTDQRARLDDNGIRVGVIGGIPPAALLNFLMTDRSNPDPHQWTKKPGDGKLLNLGGAQPECRFELVHDGANKSTALENAQCGMQITPTLRGDSVVVQFAPQVQHGKRTLWPAGDGAGGWALQGQRPVERWPHLQFEVALGNSDFAIVGERDKSDSLGRSFFRAIGDRPYQRLVAIRASRIAPASTGSVVRTEQTLPLAAQAAGVNARGQSQ